MIKLKKMKVKEKEDIENMMNIKFWNFWKKININKELIYTDLNYLKV